MYIKLWCISSPSLSPVPISTPYPVPVLVFALDLFCPWYSSSLDQLQYHIYLWSSFILFYFLFLVYLVLWTSPVSLCPAPWWTLSKHCVHTCSCHSEQSWTCLSCLIHFQPSSRLQICLNPHAVLVHSSIHSQSQVLIQFQFLYLPLIQLVPRPVSVLTVPTGVPQVSLLCYSSPCPAPFQFIMCLLHVSETEWT